MNSSVRFLVMTVLISGMTVPAFAGRESGGGDPLALEFKATAEVALKNLRSLSSGKSAPFSGINFSQLQNKLDSALILVSDKALPIEKDGITQNSAAENRPGQNLIIINRAAYTQIGNVAVQQALALHEFLSLIGLESTGSYPISGQYLIVEGGASPAAAHQAIDQASQSVATQTPCGEPSPGASTVFSMIANAGTPAQAIQSFIQTHVVSWDAQNDQCETFFDVSIDKNRQDVFRALFDQYEPDLSTPESPASDSIYSYGIGHGTLNFINFIKKEASSHQQVLSLQPVSGKDAQYLTGITETMIAAANSNIEVIRSLIQAGAGVNATTSGDSNVGTTALMYAASNNANVEVIRVLIQAGANVNASDAQGETALLCATFAPNPKHSNAIDITRALIQAGANVNAAMSDGTTALMEVALPYGNGTSYQESLQEGVIQALLQSGANVNATDSSGRTALDFAKLFNAPTGILQLLGSNRSQRRE